MDNIKKFIYTNWLEVCLISIIIIVMGIIYVSQLTASGLWYDEAVEYFYSKYMTGTVPVYGETKSMYERICSTYQPPLYNLLMYLWLLIFDTESTFRLAGVLTTFIGGLGIYYTIRKVTGYKWAIIGFFFYLSTYSVMYYALECAEYNLLLCMECWMMYFFVECIKNRQSSKSKKSIVGLYIFSVLAIYSQYGAAFPVASIILVLTCIYIKNRNYGNLRWLWGIGFFVIVVAILPLWIWFLQIQMSHQENISVSHSPVFVINVIYSFVISFVNNISWIFTFAQFSSHRFSFQIVHIGLVIFLILTLIALWKKLYVLNALIAASIVCWILFFVASACSYYAHNSWDEQLGCFNIINGFRYVLFYVPLLVVTLILGLHSFLEMIAHKRYIYISVYLISLCFMAFYARTSIHDFLLRGSKSEVREATFCWMENNKGEMVFVQEWAACTFFYYLNHSNNPHSEIIVSDTKMLTTNMKNLSEYVESLGIFSYEKFFYIGQSTTPSSPNYMEMLTQIFISHGYNIETIKEGETVVLYLTQL